MRPVSFFDLAAEPDPPLDGLALALAAEFGPVSWGPVGERLDALAREVAGALEGARVPRTAAAESDALGAVLGRRHGFTGDTSDYGDPRNSMLDIVLERGIGLPITLSVLWVSVARRAGIALDGVGLPGHYVVGHFGADPPLLLDPFAGGTPISADDVPRPLVRRWTATETALRMLNNLVRSYTERGDLSRALHAAEMRLHLTSGEERDQYESELAVLRARLN